MSDDYDDLDPVQNETFIETLEAEQRTKRILTETFVVNRQHAYRRVFAGKGEASDVEEVLADLKWFCRGGTSAFNMNERVTLLQLGRQEAYQRIQDHLNLSAAELFEKLSGAKAETL